MLHYAYDATGQIDILRDEIPGNVEFHRFAYDRLHRLTGFQTRSNDAVGGVLRSGAYSYDGEANLLTVDDSKSVVVGYGDATHPSRLLSIAGGEGKPQAATYNSRGHMDSVGPLSGMQYDALDWLDKLGDGQQVRFRYDAQSRRILKQVSKGTTTTGVRYAAGLFEQHATHALRHVYLGKQLIASGRVTGTAVVKVFYLSDHHGSVLTAINEQGTVIISSATRSAAFYALGAPLTTADLCRKCCGIRPVEKTGRRRVKRAEKRVHAIRVRSLLYP
jgi:YD repeat-containing protein